MMANLSSESNANMGNFESGMVCKLATALSHTVMHFNSFPEGIEYFSKTLGLTCNLSVDRKDTIIPKALFMGLSSFDSSNPKWIKLISETNHNRPVAELVYFMSKSCLLSFTQIVKILEATVFQVFEYNQVPNRYYMKTKQAIIISTLDQLGLVNLEYFYNENYR